MSLERGGMLTAKQSRLALLWILLGVFSTSTAFGVPSGFSTRNAAVRRHSSILSNGVLPLRSSRAVPMRNHVPHARKTNNRDNNRKQASRHHELKDSSLLSSQLAFVQRKARNLCRSLACASASLAHSLKDIFSKSWWSLPLALAVIPVYSGMILGFLPSMPSWWPLTRVDHILSSRHAKLIVSVFLGSNVSYFMSGLYLLYREGRLPPQVRSLLLGGFVLAAGTVSTVFHAVQTLGSFRMAEALCYVDHAVAITGILYFIHKCGPPGWKTSVMSALGLVTLVLTGPGYAWLHSTWHLLSAASAVSWAHEGLVRRGYLASTPAPAMPTDSPTHSR